jgi:hypothetical protein
MNDYYQSREELKENIEQYADLYTDKLFGPLFDRVDGVKNNYSWLFFDPERFFDDKQEKMSQNVPSLIATLFLMSVIVFMIKTWNYPIFVSVMIKSMLIWS